MHRWLKAVNNNANSSISSLFDAGKSSSRLWRPLEPWFTIIYICDCRTESRQSAKLFLKSSELGLHQPPTRRRVYPQPGFGSRGGGTLACGRGGGRVPIPTNGHTLWYSICICTLCCRSSSGGCDRMEGKQPDHMWPRGGISWSAGPRGRLALQLTIRRITWCW